jgi:hypothetical protein
MFDMLGRAKWYVDYLPLLTLQNHVLMALSGYPGTLGKNTGIWTDMKRNGSTSMHC